MITEDPQQAFEQAIKDNRLSARATDWNYAGHFIYMGSVKSQDGTLHAQFKHIATRRYLGEKRANAEIKAYTQAGAL